MTDVHLCHICTSFAWQSHKSNWCCCFLQVRDSRTLLRFPHPVTIVLLRLLVTPPWRDTALLPLAKSQFRAQTIVGTTTRTAQGRRCTQHHLERSHLPISTPPQMPRYSHSSRLRRTLCQPDITDRRTVTPHRVKLNPNPNLNLSPAWWQHPAATTSAPHCTPLFLTHQALGAVSMALWDPLKLVLGSHQLLR